MRAATFFRFVLVLLALLPSAAMALDERDAAGVAGVAGSYALDEEAMRAAVMAAPESAREKAEGRLEFMLAMKPTMTLKAGGAGQGTFLIPAGEHAGEKQSFPLTWTQAKGKITVRRPEDAGAAPTTCLPEGKRLRCNEGEALMIYARQ